MKKILLFFILKYNCDWERVYKALEDREIISDSDIVAAEGSVDCKYTSIIDDEYPEYLKKVYKPSFIIFHIGNLSIIKKKLFSFDGIISTWSKKILESKEISYFGNLILNGDTLEEKTLHFLVDSKLKFALVFNDIKSEECRMITSFLKQKDSNNWVVISERYMSKNDLKKDETNAMRMLYPSGETVFLSSISSIENLNEKIKFWNQENIKVFNILKKKDKRFSVDDKYKNFLTISSPKDIKIFADYKN